MYYFQHVLDLLDNKSDLHSSRLSLKGSAPIVTPHCFLHVFHDQMSERLGRNQKYSKEFKKPYFTFFR